MSLRPKIGFKRIPCETNFYSSNGIIKPTSMLHFAHWNSETMRKPLKGELYISGSIPTAYIAKQDMTSEYFIAARV